MTKAELRAQMERLLALVDERELGRRSAEVAGRFQETPAWKGARVVLCFLSMPRELDSAGLIQAAHASGRRVAVPRIERDVIRFYFLPPDAGELPRDRWGIPVPRAEWEPLALRRGTRFLVATPGLAFDRMGNRLGRGKGYYDTFLTEARAALGTDLTAIGVGLSDQLVPEVPHTERDQRLDGVVTDQESVTVS
ncbi:MAG: 5-formyltetrahydrofolate cyclo-ligase [Spirochaetia bacterium]